MSRARKQDRFSSTLTVSYREPTSSEPSLGTCADISPSGMFIETARPAARGVLVRFECIGQGQHGVVRGTARVMWIRPHGDAQGRSGMGVRFVRLEPGSARAIEELIAQATVGGARAASDGPEARTQSDEPPVVLTAERTIGPTNRSSSVPPKGLRAPTLRGMYPADVRSASSQPPKPTTAASAAREPVVSVPSGKPAAGAAPATSSGTLPPPAVTSIPAVALNSEGPRADETPILPIATHRDSAPNRSSNPPASGRKSAAPQVLRDRIERVKRADDAPTSGYRPADTSGERDRTTAPDGTAVDSDLARDRAVAARSLGSTLNEGGARRAALSGGSSARRASDHALGVPSPPPPPWKARHSERPPEPGGVEVVRTVSLPPQEPRPNEATGGAQAQPQAQIDLGATLLEATASAPDRGEAHAAEHETPFAPATAIPAEATPLPGADEPSSADWEPGVNSGRPAMRPDRAPPDISMPFSLPSETAQASTKPGRNWVPWIVVGGGVAAALAIGAMFGRTAPGIPSDPSANPTAQTPETTFLAPQAIESPQAIAATLAVVQARVEPVGAVVTALGQSVVSPGQLTLPIDSVRWPLRVRVEMLGYGATEVALPRHAFAQQGEVITHELMLALQPTPVPEAAALPPVDPKPEPAPARKPASERKQEAVAKSKAEPNAPATEDPVPAASGTPEPGKTPLDRAIECLGRGDNACVLSVLEGAKGARELDLLIETHRATNDSKAAEAAMRRYLELHPDGRRAAHYRRALGTADSASAGP